MRILSSIYGLDWLEAKLQLWVSNYNWKLFLAKRFDWAEAKTRYGHDVTFQTSLAVAVHPASKGVGYFAGNRSLVTGKSPLRSLQASPPSGACIMYSTWLFIGHLGFEGYLRKSTQTAFCGGNNYVLIMTTMAVCSTCWWCMLANLEQVGLIFYLSNIVRSMKMVFNNDRRDLKMRQHWLKWRAI